MIKVAIADDHALFREGVALLIKSMVGIELSLSASDGMDLLDKLSLCNVHIVLLDLEMKRLGGSETLTQIKRRFPSIKIIILSMHTETKLIGHMMHMGANSYLPKNVNRFELERALRTVFNEGHYINSRVADAFIIKSRLSKESEFILGNLSPKELEVLDLISKEYTSKEIGDKLSISERTVEGYRRHLFDKLDVKTSVGLIKKAITLNLIPGI